MAKDLSKIKIHNEMCKELDKIFECNDLEKIKEKLIQSNVYFEINNKNCFFIANKYALYHREIGEDYIRFSYNALGSLNYQRLLSQMQYFSMINIFISEQQLNGCISFGNEKIMLIKENLIRDIILLEKYEYF